MTLPPPGLTDGTVFLGFVIVITLYSTRVFFLESCGELQTLIKPNMSILEQGLPFWAAASQSIAM